MGGGGGCRRVGRGIQLFMFESKCLVLKIECIWAKTPQLHSPTTFPLLVVHFWGPQERRSRRLQSTTKYTTRSLYLWLHHNTLLVG